MNIIFNDEFQEKHKEDKRCYFGADFIQVNCRINIASYYLVDAPHYFANRTSEILFGERFSVIRAENEWSYIQMEDDGYCGWLPSAIIRRVFSKKEKLNKVISRLTNVYSRPKASSAIIQRLSYGAMVFVDSQFGNGGYVYSAELDGWIYRHHLDCDLSGHNIAPTNAVDLSIRLEKVVNLIVASPYVLGGRAMHGFDCSGFVQACYSATAIALPRDSDLQLDYCIYHNFLPVDVANVFYGDLIFWPGHVAMVVNSEYLVHATSNSMSIVYEPIATVLERNSVQGNEMTGIYRLPLG